MRLRPAIPGDIERIIELASVMWQACGIPDEAEDWRQSAREFLRRNLQQQNSETFLALVAEEDGAVPSILAVGTGVITARLPAPNNVSGRVGYIGWMCTAPEGRRRGTARAVLEGLLAWFERHGVIRVELHASIEGEPLYEAYGFREFAFRALTRMEKRQPGR